MPITERTTILKLNRKMRTSLWDPLGFHVEGHRFLRCVPTFTVTAVGTLHLEKLQVYEYSGTHKLPLKDRGLNCVVAPLPHGITSTAARSEASKQLTACFDEGRFQLKLDDQDMDGPDHADRRSAVAKQWATVLSPTGIANVIFPSRLQAFVHAWTDSGEPTLEKKNSSGYMVGSEPLMNADYGAAVLAWQTMCSSCALPRVLEFGGGEPESVYGAKCTGIQGATALLEAGVATLRLEVNPDGTDVVHLSKEDAPQGHLLQTEEVLLKDGSYFLKRPIREDDSGKWAMVQCDQMDVLYNMPDDVWETLPALAGPVIDESKL